jgi:hypothetical protein
VLSYRSVTKRWIDDVGERLAGEVTFEVGHEEACRAVAVAFDGARVVGRDDDVGHVPERATSWEGFGVENIEAGAGDSPGLERFDHRGLVDHLAASDVHDEGCALHRGELGGADEVAGLRRERHGHDDEV